MGRIQTADAEVERCVRERYPESTEVLQEGNVLIQNARPYWVGFES